jgi:hypothetical protein
MFCIGIDEKDKVEYLKMKYFDLHLMNLKELVTRCYRKMVNNRQFNSSNGGLFKTF